MEELSRLLKKLTIQDVEKLKVLMSCSPGDKTDSVNKEAVTLRVFAEEYKDFIQNNRSDSYLNSIITSLKYLLEFFESQKAINSISLRDTESFMIFLQKKVKKGYAVYYRNLKAAFNKALDWSYVNENYFAKVKLPKRQKLAPVFINSDELAEIIKQIDNDIVRDVVTIGFYTGMRRDEIVNLRWKNVELTTRIITVGDEEFITKGKNQRFIPICEEALEVLYRRRKSDVPARSGTGRSQKNGDQKSPMEGAGRWNRGRQKMEIRGMSRRLLFIVWVRKTVAGMCFVNVMVRSLPGIIFPEGLRGHVKLRVWISLFTFIRSGIVLLRIWLSKVYRFM